MTAAVDLSTARQFRIRVKVSGAGGFDIPGLWDTMSGSGLSVTSSETWPSGEGVVRLPGPSMPKPITITRGYAPSRDDEVITQLRANINKIRLEVTRWWVAPDGSADGAQSQTVWGDCIINDLNDPASDSSSGESAKVEMTLQPSFVK